MNSDFNPERITLPPEEAQEAALKMEADMAQKAAAPLPQPMPSVASAPLLEYVENFWQSDSEYGGLPPEKWTAS